MIALFVLLESLFKAISLLVNLDGDFSERPSRSSLDTKRYLRERFETKTRSLINAHKLEKILTQTCAQNSQQVTQDNGWPNNLAPLDPMVIKLLIVK